MASECVCVYIYIYIYTHTHTYLTMQRAKEIKIMGQRWMQRVIFGTRAIDSLAIALSVYPADDLIV